MSHLIQEGFKAGLLTIASATRQEIGSGQVTVYWHALRDLTVEEWEIAVERAVMECTFFPAVAELRRFAGVAGGSRVSIAAANAFERVLALGRHDARLVCVFPRAEKVEDLLGSAAAAAYKVAGSADAFRKAIITDDLTWVRKEFCSAFREAIADGVPQIPLPRAPALPMIGALASAKAIQTPDYEQKRRDFKAAAAGKDV